jgi:hypothetical protein
VGFFVLIILAPTCLEGLLLEVLRKTRDKVGMTGRDPLCLEGIGQLRNEVQQCKARVDEAFALAGLLGKGGGVITGQFEQLLKALRFLIRMHAEPLTILDLSLVLQKLSITSTTMDSRTWWNLYL